MKTLCYNTKWAQLTNHVILLFDDNPTVFPVGIIELTTWHAGENKGKAYIWNLHINTEHRQIGYGRHLLNTALGEAVKKGCHTVELEWSSIDSPRWVFRWYLRQGFSEVAFSGDNVLLRKN